MKHKLWKKITKRIRNAQMHAIEFSFPEGV